MDNTEIFKKGQVWRATTLHTFTRWFIFTNSEKELNAISECGMIIPITEDIFSGMYGCWKKELPISE
jgi:hypothetical protein